MPYPSLSPLRRLEELLNTAARLRLVAHQVPSSAMPFPRPHARLQHLHRELDRIIADVAEGTAIITAVATTSSPGRSSARRVVTMPAPWSTSSRFCTASPASPHHFLGVGVVSVATEDSGVTDA